MIDTVKGTKIFGEKFSELLNHRITQNNNKVKITDACGVRRPSAGLNYFGVNRESETKINDVDKTHFNNRGTFCKMINDQ